MNIVKYPKYLEREMNFGRLTVISVDENSKIDKNGKYNPPSLWKYTCVCSCSEKSLVSIARRYLLEGHTKSCGCISKELITKRNQENIKINPIKNCGDYIEVFFFNKSHGYFKVDKKDYGKVKNYCWVLRPNQAGNLYAEAAIKGTKNHIMVHHVILLPSSGMLVDHINGDGLDNRMHNLREATFSQNSMNSKKSRRNTSGTTGVYWAKDRCKWWALIVVNNRRISLGYFIAKEEAIKVRKAAEVTYFGEFSLDNSRNKE